MTDSKVETYRRCVIETFVSEVGEYFSGTFIVHGWPGRTGKSKFVSPGDGLYRTREGAHGESARVARRMVDVIQGCLDKKVALI